ncbi:hypothetical protein BJY04DRAFT_217253 [Aspergillus karnatakaensis]|uniref:fungal specific transcription factor domain-containing protein n=1 Tax=Aspergillus karnatakaensis TaxID=1810916 RepID=UPI003CCDBFD3
MPPCRLDLISKLDTLHNRSRCLKIQQAGAQKAQALRIAGPVALVKVAAWPRQNAKQWLVDRSAVGVFYLLRHVSSHLVGADGRRTLDKLRNEQLLSSGSRGYMPYRSSTDRRPPTEFEVHGRQDAEPQPHIHEFVVKDAYQPSNNDILLETQGINEQRGAVASHGERSSSFSKCETRGKTLHIPNELPVEHSRDHENTEPRGLQDPLWVMASLAEQGWNLHGTSGHQSDNLESPASRTANVLPPEETNLLSKWGIQDLQEIEKEHSLYYEHGLFGSKCDVARDLDPIQRGLLAEQRAVELFQAYFALINPQWAILDSTLHTLAYVRARSALLMTTILALGSTALSLITNCDEDKVTEALRLHTHAQNLKLVVFAAGARSIEIIQSHILLSRWGVSPKIRFDEQRWMHAAMIPRMAFEIGLNLSHRYDKENAHDAQRAEQLRRNDCRTKAFMIINEHRFSSFSGRNPMDLYPFELNETQLEEVMHLGWGQSTRSLAALYQLFLFDRDVRQRLDQHRVSLETSLSLDAELEHIKSYLENWIQRWCGSDEVHLHWHLKHDTLSCWLLLAVHIARKRTQSGAVSHYSLQEKQWKQQQLLLALSARLFKESLQAPEAVRMTHRAGIFPFAASILLRFGEHRDLVLRTALRMAGEPGKLHVPTKTHLSRAPSPIPQANSQHFQNLSQMAEKGSQAMAEHMQQPCLNQQTMRHNIQERPLSLSAGEINDLYPLWPQIGVDIIPSFNIAEFPYVPNPTLSPRQVHDPLYLPASPIGDLNSWAAAEFENWLGTTALENGVPTQLPSKSLQSSSVPVELTEHEPSPYNMNSGLLLESISSCQAPIRIPRDIPPWNGDHAAIVSAKATSNASNTPGEACSEQRKVLLSAVDRLIQLVSLIE